MKNIKLKKQKNKLIKLQTEETKTSKMRVEAIKEPTTIDFESIVPNFNYEAIRDEFNCYPNSKIYVGADSFVHKILVKGAKPETTIGIARFAIAIAVHRNSNCGCSLWRWHESIKFFGMQDRLMKEVYLASSVVIKLFDFVDPSEVETHLDINPNKQFRSSDVLQQALGYFLAATNTKPIVKPNSFMASRVADSCARGLSLGKCNC